MNTGGRKADWDNHLDAFWYVLLNANAWRALPSEFGHWFTLYQFFNQLCLVGFFDFLHGKLICGSGAEAVFFDSTHIKVHQHANGPQNTEDQSVGKSRGGRNTRLHAAMDALGRLASEIIITSGNVSDFTAAPDLIKDLRESATRDTTAKPSGISWTSRAANPASRPAVM